MSTQTPKELTREEILHYTEEFKKEAIYWKKRAIEQERSVFILMMVMLTAALVGFCFAIS